MEQEPAATAEPEPRLAKRRLRGLLVCKYRWGLSVQAKLLVFATVVGAGATIFLGIYPFLAVTQRVDARVLVVEGWMHSYGILAGAEEFRKGGYEKLYTTGGPLIGKGGYSNDFKTSASVGADELKKAGISDERIQMVPSRVIGRDRTYSSATALRDWWREHNVQARSVNIVTEDTHARRSRLLFQKALGPSVAVGVIAISSPEFDARHWWRYSEGVQAVVAEALGYTYAKFLFHPSEAEERWGND